MRNPLTRCIFFIFLIFPAVSLGLKKEEENRSWVTFGVSYSIFYFEDEVYEEFFDKDSFSGAGLSIGFYPLRNLELSASGRILFEKGYALGEITGEESGEEFNLSVYPLQLSLSYRFDFLHEQLMVPVVSAGGDYYLYREARDFDDDVEGGKSGYHVGAGIGILLDQLDVDASSSLKSEFGVKNVFLDIRYETAFIGEEDDEEGLDFTNESWYGCLVFEF